MNTLSSQTVSVSDSTLADGADGERANAPVPFRVVAFGATVLDPNGPPAPGSKPRVRSGVRGGIVIGSRPGTTTTPKRGIVIGS